MNYDAVQASGAEREKIIVGGHKLIVKGVKERQNSKGGDMLVVAYDFASNDHQPGYFKKMFDADIRPEKQWPFLGTKYINVNDMQGNCSRDFKAFITSVERSNPGFVVDWDAVNFGEQFKSKMLGGVFGEVHDCYNGNEYTRVELRWFCDLANAPSAKVPELKDNMARQRAKQQPAGYQQTARATGAAAPTQNAVEESDIPF